MVKASVITNVATVALQKDFYYQVKRDLHSSQRFTEEKCNRFR